MSPQVSHLLITYNQADFVADALNSVLEQTYPDTEVVISDDCSSDGTLEQIEPFLDDPRVPMTNNAAERSLRGIVVGRKNHYGSKSVPGTEVAALFYSLIESAKLCGVEPRA